MLQYFFYFVNEIMLKIKTKITFTYMLTFEIKYSIFSIEKEKFNFINNFKEEIEMFERSSGILLHPTSLPASQ